MDKLLNELQEIERLAQELEDLKRDMVECHTLREAAREAGEAVQKLQEASQTTAAGEKDKVWLLLPNGTFSKLSHEKAVHSLEEEVQALGQTLQRIQDKQKALLLDLRQKESTSEHVGSNLVSSMLEAQEPR